MAKKQIATFLGTQPGLSVLGDHAYAFSGAVQDAGSGAASTSCLKFTTGNFYFVGTIEWVTNNTGNENLYIDITQNGSSVYAAEWDNSVNQINYDQPIRMMIAPRTDFEVKWGIDTNTKNLFVVMIGRIYDA